MENTATKRPAKQAKTYRLSPVALTLLEQVSAQEGKTNTGALEEAIRLLAKKYLKIVPKSD